MRSPKHEVQYYDWRLTVWTSSETRDRLDATGRGIYRELLDHCYAQGSFPDDEEWVCRKCACTSREYAKWWPVIQRHFAKSRREGHRHNGIADIWRSQYFSYLDRQRSNRKMGVGKSSNGNNIRDGGRTVVNPRTDDGSTKERKKERKKEREESSSNTENNIVRSALSADAQSAWLAEHEWGGVKKASADVLTKIQGFRESDFIPCEKSDSLYMIWARLNWFEEFWAEYWRHVERKSALISYFQAVTSLEMHEQIMAAVQAQAPAMLKREEKHRPHASTWIHGERWNDTPEGELFSDSSIAS